MSDILIRNARPEDLDFAFEMTIEAGNGMIERFLGCGSKEHAYRVFKVLWKGRANRFHYTNTKIAESGDEKLGILVSYSVEENANSSLSISQILKAGGCKMIWYYMTHITDLFTALSLPEGKLEEYYISTIATPSKARGKGVGTILIHYALNRAKELNIKQASLIVAKDNAGAIKLYKKLGFIIDHSQETKHNHRMILNI
jgi:ribosomal protein S18 acetylase RimI-like enzyme